MGAFVMLGTLFGLIVIVYGVVLRFDPEARPPAEEAPAEASASASASASTGEVGE